MSAEHPPLSENVVSPSPFRSKYKLWCFTDFQTARLPEFDPGTMDYLVYGTETCPQTNRPHVQGFVAFKTRQYITGAKRLSGTAHFERCRGTPEENRSYCVKDGNYREFGTLPKVVPRGNGFADAISKAEAGKLEDLKLHHPGLYVRYKKTFESLVRHNNDELSASCGIWMSGPPRSGKDFGVTSFFRSVYLKNCNKWFDGYEGEECLLVSDLDRTHQHMGSYLKIWADRYKFRAETKGGSMLIRPKFVCVTSNYEMDEIFEGNILSALRARFARISYHPVGGMRVVQRPVFQPNDRFLKALRDVVPKDEVDLVPKAGPSNEKTPAEEEIDSEGPKRKKKHF